MPWAPGYSLYHTPVPSPGMFPCAGLSSAHVFWQSRAKRKKSSPSSRFSGPGTTSEISASSGITCHPEQFSSRSQHTGADVKARVLEFGGATSEVEMKNRLSSLSLGDGQSIYQEQRDHPHSQSGDLRPPFSDKFGQRAESQGVKRRTS